MKSNIDPRINLSWAASQAKERFEHYASFDMSTIIDYGIKLDQFLEDDWIYSPNYDVLFVRTGSKLYTWIALQTG